MRFADTSLSGTYVITPDRLQDERGFFALTWCASEFEKRGLPVRAVQTNISYNARRGTLRGMHYQAAPFEQPKLVRCTMGAIYDVVVDLRPDSGTFRRWVAVELSEDNRQMLYIPAGLAHGFQTLCDESEVLYQMFEVYAADAARGVRWDDPSFAIRWPLEVTVISDRDANYPDSGL